MDINVLEYNRNAWNLQSEEGCRWSTPFSDEVIENAKTGDWSVILTPNKAVPDSWFPNARDLEGVSLLALACGGGQQVPVFAAAGAAVTSYDASDVQLQKDIVTCRKHNLDIDAVQGDMADMSGLESESFDLIFNPVSNVFAEKLEPIWKECHRVLKPGGTMLCGFMNPCFFLFDHEILEETGKLLVKQKLPYSDYENMDAEMLGDHLEAQVSLEYSHSWETQLGGQCDAGFAVSGFYEDDWDEESTRLQGWFPMFAATKSVKVGK